MNQTDQSETRTTESQDPLAPRADSDSVEFVKSELIASSISESDNMPKKHKQEIRVESPDEEPVQSPQEDDEEAINVDSPAEDEVKEEPEPEVIKNLVKEQGYEYAI